MKWEYVDEKEVPVRGKVRPWASPHLSAGDEDGVGQEKRVSPPSGNTTFSRLSHKQNRGKDRPSAGRAEEGNIHHCSSGHSDAQGQLAYWYPQRSSLIILGSRFRRVSRESLCSLTPGGFLLLSSKKVQLLTPKLATAKGNNSPYQLHS